MPRLWVDLTTSWEERGRIAHGTTRVERGIVGAFAALGDPGIGFVAFDRASQRFRPITPEAIPAIVAGPVAGNRDRQRAGVWRRRVWGMQARLARLWPRRPPPDGAPDPFADGDQLLLSGEHSRHDFAGLLARKRAKRLGLAFVMFDLLHVLPDGDARLADPDATDLPQTDFIAREADIVLPISRFSAAEFRAHLARRGVPGPPIHPIRLAGAIPSFGGRPMAVAPGFVLCVGDVVARKNHALLVRVWAALGQAAPPLLIVGRIDLEGNALVDQVRRDPALRPRIRFLPNLDDDALVWLYRHCRFTVFPSRLEGFGLPVAESLAYGKVCVASSAAAIPEAGQGCTISLDPDDSAAWAACIRALARDDRALAEAEAAIRAFRPVAWSDTVSDLRAVLLPA